MKALSMLFLALFLGKGCDTKEKQDLESAAIEYVANTRGYYQKIVVQNQTIVVFKNRDGSDHPAPKKISDADWKSIVIAFQELDLEGIPNLKAPTEKRFYDGAAIANLKVTYKAKNYETNGFDHGNPPVEIEKIVTKINELAKE